MGALEEVAMLATGPAAWHEPAALTLDEHGMILDCSPSCEALFGYAPPELFQQHVSKLLPQFSEVELFHNGEPNAMIAFLCRIGHLFQLRRCCGATFTSELSFVHLSHAGKSILRLIATRLPGHAG